MQSDYKDHTAECYFGLNILIEGFYSCMRELNIAKMRQERRAIALGH